MERSQDALRVRVDSKGREHAPGCTFDGTTKRWPLCSCGAWPAPHLNTALDTPDRKEN